MAPDSVGLPGLGEDSLGGHAQDGLEEVVIEPHLVVEAVEEACLGHSVESCVAQVGADEGGILLLDEAVVILVKGSGARDLDAFDDVPPQAKKVVIEELAAVVGVDL